MVDTIKFSQMPSGGNINNNDVMPSLLGGENVLINNPWTFLPSGTTAQRPSPSSIINYRLRFNTDEQLYEYYDAILGEWTQLQESAFTQGPFVIYTADPAIPDGQNLGALANGILKQTISAGIATLDIAVNGTDFYGPGYTGYLIAPLGIADINNNPILETISAGASAVNFLRVSNNATGNGPSLTAEGADTDVAFNISSKGMAPIGLVTQAPTTPLLIFSGTSNQHLTRFSFSNTANDRTVTFQDASGTVAYLSDININFQNVLEIANNGNDSTGDGSFGKPFATLNGAFAVIISPSSTNTYLISDNRVGSFTENVALLPFVSVLNNGGCDLNGNITLDASFGSVTSDAFTVFGGYKSIGFGSASILTLDFSGLPVTHKITVNLINIDAALFGTGSAIVGKSHSDGSNKFVVNFKSVNCANDFTDSTAFISDINISSGVNFNTYNSINQVSSVTKEATINNVATQIYMYNSLGMFGSPSTFTTTITVNVGNNTQTIDWNVFGGGNSTLDFDYVNFPTTGAGLSFTFDSNWTYFIDSINPSGDQPTFNPQTITSYIRSGLSPVNFTPTAFEGDGQEVPAQMVDAYLNGIDIALGNLEFKTPQIIGADFTIPDSIVLGPPQTWIIASFPSAAITITLPANPLTGEIHRFIASNGGDQVTIAGNGGFGITGSLFKNVAGVANITTPSDAASIDLVDASQDHQVCELQCDNAAWVPFYSMGWN